MNHTTSNDTEAVVVPSVTALIGILVTGLLYLVLPANLVIGPNWLLLVVEVVFVVPLAVDVLTAWNLSHSVRRMLVLVPLGVSTLSLIVGVALLILSLPTDIHATNLLRTAALLWAFNILVFALWYFYVKANVRSYYRGLKNSNGAVVGNEKAPDARPGRPPSMKEEP